MKISKYLLIGVFPDGAEKTMWFPDWKLAADYADEQDFDNWEIFECVNPVQICQG